MYVERCIVSPWHEGQREAAAHLGGGSGERDSDFDGVHHRSGVVQREYYFPGQLELEQLLRVNAGLFCLHLCLGGICFLASCLFSETKYSLGVGAGLPILMYVFQMMANMGGKAENAKYFTVFTLFQPEELAAGESGAVVGALVLLALGLVLYGAAVAVFTRKDLHI